MLALEESKKLKVLTVGAVGPAAGLIVPELLKRDVAIRGLVHKAVDERIAGALGLSEIVVGDLANASDIAKALAGMDAAFYIAPAFLDNEAEVGMQFVAAAKRAGVRRLVFSSVIHPVLLELTNHTAKIPVEDALLNSGMEFVFLHPAMFFQNLAPAWGKVKATGSYGEPWSAEIKFSRVDYRDVAEAAAIALTEDRLLFGTFELCAEGNLNRHELAALMSVVLGNPVKAHTIRSSLQSGPSQEMMRMFAWYDKHPLLGNATTLRAILQREPRTLRAYLEELNR